MTIWRPNLDGRSGPVYRQIADAIGDGIASAALAAGDRLPPQRDLAYELGISLNTVSRAYADARRRGFLHGEVGRGTYVRETGPLDPQVVLTDLERPESGPIDFSLNLPAPGRAAAFLARTLAEIGGSDRLSTFLDYQMTGDRKRHTAAAANLLRRLGLKAESRNIVVTSGSQHGLLVAMLATMRPGDVLLTETLTYAPVKALARHLGLTIVPVDIDKDGIIPDALDAVCRKVAATALYCLPTLHTPTMATMQQDRREAVAALARRHDLVVIEDDVFAFLPTSRPRPVACFAPERTIYATSVSKSLAPGLRVGYLHAPEMFADRLRSAVNLSCWMPPPLMAEIATRWIEDGTAQKLNEFQRSEATARQSLARRILGHDGVIAHSNGFHVWLELAAHWRPEAFRLAAERRGVKVLTGATFAVDGFPDPQAVRLCLSYEVSQSRVAKGLELIAGLLEGPADAGALVL